MSVLESFFRIAMVLTIITLVINAGIVTFGEALTGETINVVSDPFLGVGIEISDSEIVQSDLGGDVPTQSLATWIAISAQVVLFVGGLQLILLHILTPIGLGTIAIFLATILSIFQLFGISYVIFALLSAWKGGGSP